jgi:hypothetical protein
MENNLAHMYPVKEGIVVSKWLRNFLLHDPHLSLQMPESLSWGRVLGSTAKKVALLFVLLESSSGKK